MNFSELARKGIERIYAEDFEFQDRALSVIMSEVRGMPDHKILMDARAFLVPNNEYLINYFGMEARHESFDLYSYDGTCKWDNFILFPVYNVVDRIVGFVGFDHINKLKKKHGEDLLEGHYRYTNKEIFERGKYIYTHQGIYKKAVEEGYIILVDGVFDMHNFVSWGFNSAALLGSSLSPELLFQLKFIKHIFVAQDNDRAGGGLFRELERALPSVRYIRQGYFKDSDDTLNGHTREEYIEKIRYAIKTNSSFVLKRKHRFSVS